MKLMTTALTMLFFAQISFAGNVKKFVTDQSCRIQYQVELAADMSAVRVYHPVTKKVEIISKKNENELGVEFVSVRSEPVTLGSFPLYRIVFKSELSSSLSSLEAHYSGVVDQCFLIEATSDQATLLKNVGTIGHDEEEI